MYPPHPLGYPAPAGLQLSREAARRHEQAVAVRENPLPTGPGPVQRLWAVLARRRAATAGPATPRRRPTRRLDAAARDCVECA